jgi:hypothetical protein
MTGTGASNTCEPEKQEPIMSEIVVAKINSFAPIAAQNDFPVPPLEEPVFILTASQLRGIIQEAIQPFQDRIEDLEKIVATQGEQIAALTSTQEQDVNRICMDIAFDRQRLARLEKPIKEPGKTERSRAEKIERYLSSRPDHKATFETLKGHLGIDNVLLSQTIKTLMESSPGRYGLTRTLGDKRKRTLVMLPK